MYCRCSDRWSPGSLLPSAPLLVLGLWGAAKAVNDKSAVHHYHVYHAIDCMMCKYCGSIVFTVNNCKSFWNLNHNQNRFCTDFENMKRNMFMCVLYKHKVTYLNENMRYAVCPEKWAYFYLIMSFFTFLKLKRTLRRWEEQKGGRFSFKHNAVSCKRKEDDDEQ